MLSDKESQKHLVRKKRKTTDMRKRWGDSQKLEAVKCWLLTGNLAATAAALDIPLVTLKVWRYSQWWDDAVRDIRSENNMALTARLKKIAARSLDLVEDRLENGDWVLNNKTGKLMQKPIGIRDLGVITNTTLTHIDKIEGQPSREADTKKAIDQLQLLAQKFEEFSKKKAPVQVTDVIFVENDDAVYEKRKEGLSGGGTVGEDESSSQSPRQGSTDEEPESHGESRESVQV